jgi:nucleoside 2-deoxyribosyltransferase
MKKIYLAGPLFTEYEQKQRKYEAEKIREVIEGTD